MLSKKLTNYLAIHCRKGPVVRDFWERLARSVKRCLRKLIGRALLTFDEMATLVVEIEATLNNRPLTYVPV